MLQRPLLTGFVVALLGVGLGASCGGTVERVRASVGGEAPSAGGAGGAAAAGGRGGQGGEALPGRGDPADFPTDCSEACDDACARLAQCGGASSPSFPIEEEDCLDRCERAEYSHSGDLSVTFKCCTSQTDCEDVAQCGGWLAHPDAVASCARYCECRTYSGLAQLVGSHQAPEGYRFAPDLLWIDTGRASVDLSTVPATAVLRGGRHPLVRLGPTADRSTITELEARGRVLPTFVDGAGHVSAATGDLVVFVDGAEALGRALAEAAPYGLRHDRKIAATLRRWSGAQIHLLRGSDAWQTLDAVVALSSVEGVHAELDHIRHYVKRYTPNDPMFADQWHLLNVGQNGSTVSVDGRVSEAWDITRGDASVILAINDDGVDLDHPEFAGKLEPELNFPDDWQTQMQQSGFGSHGTSVTGVAAAKADNAEGGAGVCPNCRILPHLLGDSSGGGFEVTDAQIADGFIAMVDAGAAVINNSWGYDPEDPTYVEGAFQFPPLAAVVEASFEYAETEGRGGLGTLIFFAAGNSNTRLDPLTAYETNVSVSAVDDLGLKPYYSSFGPQNDLAAPTNGGLNAITTTAPNSDYTTEFGGTSSASPFAVGVAGLVLSAGPTLTAAEVRALLAATATKIDPVFGQWDAEGHSDFHGAGLVNAYAAVAVAAGVCAAAEDCVAPSDDCGAQCATLTECQVCRTARDCADGYVCQARPSLGELICVAVKGTDDCPDGTTEVNGYCLPSAAHCGVCPGTEECNGRDDDCNGPVDDGDVCQSGALCFIDGPGCEEGLVCLGRRCSPECELDTDCQSGESCETLKDQYGATPGVKGCVAAGGWPSGSCELRCEVRASSLDDAALAAFIDCMEDGEADCSVREQCRELLP